LTLQIQLSLLISGISLLNFSNCYQGREAQFTEYNGMLWGLQTYWNEILALIWASWYIYIFFGSFNIINEKKKEIVG
jgi:hypothetical protein